MSTESNSDDVPNPYDEKKAYRWRTEQEMWRIAQQQIQAKYETWRALKERRLPIPLDLERDVKKFDKRG